MKKVFLEPELEVIKFGAEDVITTSSAEEEIGGAVDPGKPDPGEDPFGEL